MPAHESGRPDDGLPEHLLPEDSRPGAHGDHLEDVPNLDDFAERLGIKEPPT
jgi:hypothetical protein